MFEKYLSSLLIIDHRGDKCPASLHRQASTKPPKGTRAIPFHLGSFRLRGFGRARLEKFFQRACVKLGAKPYRNNRTTRALKKERLLFAWNQLFGRRLGGCCCVCGKLCVVHRVRQELAKASAAFAEVMQKRQPWKMLVVIVQSLILALVLAYFIGLIGGVNWMSAVRVGLLLWIGLSAVQWLGSIMWENVPVKMAAIHASDWLVKLVLIAGIVGVWR